MVAKPKIKAKAAAKPRKPGTPAPKKTRDGMKCDVCGFRVIVDEACGCVEEHVLLCCDRPMTKTKVLK